MLDLTRDIVLTKIIPEMKSDIFSIVKNQVAKGAQKDFYKKISQIFILADRGRNTREAQNDTVPRRPIFTK